MKVSRAITVRRPRSEVYAFWRDFENLPRFMYHLAYVENLGSGRSHWVARAPAGRSVEWDAEIIADRPDEEISWRTMGKDDDVRHTGSVYFVPAPGDRGTEVHVRLNYDAPGGKVGAMVARLFGEEPSQQVDDDLRRFKQVMEVGEVVRSEASPEGTGQGIMRQQANAPQEANARL
ncbi:MAG TPA: SRPBCC family protein [Gemmatimonadaceae bacterium]